MTKLNNAKEKLVAKNNKTVSDSKLKDKLDKEKEKRKEEEEKRKTAESKSIDELRRENS